MIFAVVLSELGCPCKLVFLFSLLVRRKEMRLFYRSRFMEENLLQVPDVFRQSKETSPSAFLLVVLCLQTKRMVLDRLRPPLDGIIGSES